MELKPAKRKKFSAPRNCPFIPIESFEGRFDGSRCWINNPDHVSELFKMVSKENVILNGNKSPFLGILWERVSIKKRTCFQSTK